MEYEITGERYGGKLSEHPKPWILKFGRKDSERRQVKIHSNVWGIMELGNGHHHVTIEEEGNLILCKNDDGKTYLWGKPWHWEDDTEMYQSLKGRRDFNDDFTRKRDVIKWAVDILKEWGVIGNKTYKIDWDLCDDDPMTTQKDETVSDLIRKRIERRM